MFGEIISAVSNALKGSCSSSSKGQPAAGGTSESSSGKACSRTTTVPSVDDTAQRNTTKEKEKLKAECFHLKGLLAVAEQKLQHFTQDNEKLKAECSHVKGLLEKVEGELQHVSQENEEMIKDGQLLNVLLQSERQENDRIMAECVEYKAVAAERILVGPNVINPQASHLSKPELLSEIKQTVTVNVMDWSEEISTKLGPHASILPRLLAQVFLECHTLVETRRVQVHSFFTDGSETPHVEKEMDQNAAEFMRKHTRRHFKTIFPLTGQKFDEAYATALANLGTWMYKTLIDGIATEEAVQVLEASGLLNVVKQYLVLIVNATLQHPREEFADDCGEEQTFDPEVHADPIDGDVLQPGDKCLVVFPALPSQQKFVLRFDGN